MRANDKTGLIAIAFVAVLFLWAWKVGQNDKKMRQEEARAAVQKCVREEDMSRSECFDSLKAAEDDRISTLNSSDPGSNVRYRD